MKTDQKGFDALAFKAQAQERLCRETEGMSPEEEARWLHGRVASGPFKELLVQVSAAEAGPEKTAAA